jgi:hypothetical protein
MRRRDQRGKLRSGRRALTRKRGASTTDGATEQHELTVARERESGGDGAMIGLSF